MTYEELSPHDRAIVDQMKAELDQRVAEIRAQTVPFGVVYDAVKELLAHPSLGLAPHKQTMTLNALSARIRKATEG